MSDTPETDAATWVEVGYNSFVVSASISSKLERERDEAREECDKLKLLLAADSERVDAYLGVCMERDEAREEINRYREKLDLLPISLDV